VVVISWYVLRTLSGNGNEETAVSILRRIFPEVELVFPRRRVSWRKQGGIISIIRPLFEGYLFVDSDEKKIGKFDELLRIHKLNVAQLLYSGGTLVPIFDEEKHLILQLIGRNGIVEASTVARQEEHLQVVKGPLVGLEHLVKKISDKKRRITVEIPVMNEKRKVELEGILID
jgi:transcriptional antiterminator NusG